MAFIDHNYCIVFISEIADGIELGNGSIHAEDAVSYNDPAAEVSGFFEFVLQVCHFIVLVAIALCFTQANTVDDRSVVECIRYNSILLIEQGFEHSTIGIEGCYVQDGVFCSEELRQFVFEFFMDVLCAADETNTAHAVAMRVDIFMGCLDGFRMRRKSEVVVGAKVQYFFTVNSYFGALW